MEKLSGGEVKEALRRQIAEGYYGADSAGISGEARGAI